MLVLARKRGERIRINNDVWIIVIRVDGDVVRLGIAAPQGVSILREELLHPDERYPDWDSRPHGD